MLYAWQTVSFCISWPLALSPWSSSCAVQVSSVHCAVPRSKCAASRLAIIDMPVSMLDLASNQHTLALCERLYVQDVLHLRNGESEDALGEHIKGQARELGLTFEAETKAQSIKTTSSDIPRRSTSVYSEVSQSTGLTSSTSDLSRNRHGLDSQGRSRASLSLHDYDGLVARGRSDGRSSVAYSRSSTPADSIFSLPPSSPESSRRNPFRRIRGLSVLKLGRIERASSQCPHCPLDKTSQRRAVHKLPCGHRLCTQALRNSIEAAAVHDPQGTPSCCGRPIPSLFVEHALSQEEQRSFSGKLDKQEHMASAASDGKSSFMDGMAERPGASRTISIQSKVDSLSPQVRVDWNRASVPLEVQLLRKQQEEQLERFIAWSDRVTAELNANHDRATDAMRLAHERAVEDLHEQHAQATFNAEDKQVKAEADMRDAQAKEQRDNGIALKHMEAYCAGTYSNGAGHDRIVTEQDRAELDKTRRARDQMGAKHASAINVLRGEQDRRMRLRSQRQEKEIQELRRTQRNEELELERGHHTLIQKLAESSAAKKSRLVARWQLQIAICMKKLEPEAETMLGNSLPLVK